MLSPAPIIIQPATTPADLAAAKGLFTAYVESLPIDIAYQNFQDELATLPGKYAASRGGVLLLARRSLGDDPIGCIALRALPTPGCCEMKRLYVTDAGRGSGVGRLLVQKAVDAARGLGYKEIRLDTLPTMSAALKLYGGFGFKQIGAYYVTPIEDTIFLGLML